MPVNATPTDWTNDATYAAHLFLSSMRYGESMAQSRNIFREQTGADRSTVALQRFTECIREMTAADKLAGHFVGIGLDDIDFVQIADYWLAGIAAYQRQCEAVK